MRRVWCFFLSVVNPPKISGTETTYIPTPWNLGEKNETPIFCGFTNKGKTLTPNTTVQHKEELSYLMECVDQKQVFGTWTHQLCEITKFRIFPYTSSQTATIRIPHIKKRL